MATIMNILGSIFLVILITNQAFARKCVRSKTTASGTAAPKGTICKGQLIFNDDFDTLRQNVWEHEVNLYGGGVRDIYCPQFLYK